MKNTFFNIKLTEEQEKAVGGDVKELVAVDFVKIERSETDRGRPYVKLTKEQAYHVRKVTGEDPRDLRITWRPALQSLPSKDIKEIENVTLRGCDTWSVPAQD